MAQQRGSFVPILIDTEIVYKTTPTPASHKLYYTSESVRLNQNLISSKTLRGSRQPVAPILGARDVAGDINFELNPQMGKLFKHVFGGYGVAGGGAPYTHTYSVGNLPVGMCMEKQFIDLSVPKYFLYNGCKINTFKMTAKPEGTIDCSISVIGAKETISGTSFHSSPTDPGCTAFDGFSSTVKINTVTAATVTSFDLTLENNLDGNTYVMDGTGLRRSLPEGISKVSGTMQCLFEDILLYLDAVNKTEKSLEISFLFGAGTGASAGNEKMTFLLDELIFRPQAPVVSGPTGILIDLPFEAYLGNDSDANAFRMVLLSPTATF